MSNTITTIIASVGGVGGILAFLKFFIFLRSSKKKNNAEADELVSNNWSVYATRMEARVDKLEAKVDRLIEEKNTQTCAIYKAYKCTYVPSDKNCPVIESIENIEKNNKNAK